MYEIIKRNYKTLIKDGWKLNQIDESDIFFLFELNTKEEIKYADQVPWL